jgi:hypothetical protein
MKIKLFILLISFSQVLSAAVWNDTQIWSLSYEEKFSDWMMSNKVYEKIFTDKNSPYLGISTDCADTAYALRAIFAFENSLPFVINSPSGDRNGKKLSNHLNNWDYAGDSNKRLVAMVNEVSESVGTSNLTRIDTFPVALKAIRPGTLFTISTSGRFGQQIHHTYNIKNINPIGTFDVIYSTQAIQHSGLPLVRRKDRELVNLPHDPWGFRKFRWPEHLNQELSVIPEELGPSLEQFTLAASLGQAGFFKYLKQIISTTTEPPENRMIRSFKALCEDAQARIEYVNQGLDFLQQINNRCMNYTEFDTYSTPARDEALKETYLKVQSAYQEIKNNGDLDQVSPEWIDFSEIIFNRREPTEESSARLLEFCPINYRRSIAINLATLWSRLEANKLSSHPNDLVEIRWGEKDSPLTKCKRWY